MLRYLLISTCNKGCLYVTDSFPTFTIGIFEEVTCVLEFFNTVTKLCSKDRVFYCICTLTSLVALSYLNCFVGIYR